MREQRRQTVTNTKTIRVSHRFSATAGSVFDAWLDPIKARKFLFATPTGEMVKAETDPRVGGRFTFTDRRDGVDVAHTGEYLAIERPRRLAFNFSVPMYSPIITTVTLDIVPFDGGCDLTLTHEGVPAEYEEGGKRGWGGILAGLAASLA
jgi:uncharacterized protein YndB with AHSA1/START domain